MFFSALKEETGVCWDSQNQVSGPLVMLQARRDEILGVPPPIDLYLRSFNGSAGIQICLLVITREYKKAYIVSKSVVLVIIWLSRV